MKNSRYLYLLRHAKSSWKDATLPDWARLLSDRGKRDAPLMAQRLTQQEPLPQMIISSPAVRAFDTACVMAHALNKPDESIIIREEIYEANVETLTKLINRIDDKFDCVMLVGHNPGFTELVNELCKESLGNLPTCAWVRIRFDIDNWRDVGSCPGQWEAWDKPKLAKMETQNQ